MASCNIKLAIFIFFLIFLYQYQHVYECEQHHIFLHNQYFQFLYFILTSKFLSLFYTFSQSFISSIFVLSTYSPILNFISMFHDLIRKIVDEIYGWWSNQFNGDTYLMKFYNPTCSQFNCLEWVSGHHQLGLITTIIGIIS